MKYKFPQDLFTDVRIEDYKSAAFYVKNGEVESNSEVTITGAMIRIFDGKMWYTAETNDIESIQTKIDELALLAKPNPNILKNKIIKNYSVNNQTIRVFNNENDLRKLTRQDRESIVWDYYNKCVDKKIKEIKANHASFYYSSKIKYYYNSKGTCIEQDYQRANIHVGFEIVVDGVNYWAFKTLNEFEFEKLKGREKEFLEERDRTLDYAKNGVPVEPGEYTCVLAPAVTAVFTHESFGHKSESDFMLNDKTLQKEWVLGKKVANEKVSIIDEGDGLYHGYCPYDDEGNKKQKVFLIKDGILTGRLHDAKSAAILKEKPTGNARAQDSDNTPLVRMTNTFMDAGTDDPQDIIKGVKDGIYVYDWNYGTGQSTFTIQPKKCYRIRDGKICEPLRVNVVTGSVFKTLFDIDAVGNDLEFFSGTCGKGSQSIPTATGGPTIRVKKLTIN